MQDASFPKTRIATFADAPITTVHTRPQAELEDLLARGSAVCIGVVGPPGTGKTSLMATACYGSLSPDRPRLLGLRVSVSASADPNEIARQLVLSLCAELLGEQASPRLHRDSNVFARKATLISSVAAVAGAVLLVLSARGVRINTQVGLGWVLLVAGVIGLLSRLETRLGRFTRRTSFQNPAGPFSAGGSVRRPRKLYERAAALAESLDSERRFETTVTSGWTTGLTPFTGLQLNSSGSVSKKLLPTPLSDLAQLYAQLVADVAVDTPLLISIDGLDKCDPNVDIDQTLFELRPFLAARGCRYLIALGENSEPRAFLRSSLIDAIVRCELLTVDDARRLIRSRVTSLPDAVAALCFAASGGLPRDMLRITQYIHDQLLDWPDLTVASACIAMIQKELQTLSDELRWAARGLPNWAQQQRLFTPWAEV